MATRVFKSLALFILVLALASGLAVRASEVAAYDEHHHQLGGRACVPGPLTVSGRIFYDVNGDKKWTPGVDRPVSKLHIFFGRKGRLPALADGVTSAAGLFVLKAPLVCRASGFIVSLKNDLSDPIYSFWMSSAQAGKPVLDNIQWAIPVPKTTAKKRTSTKKARSSIAKKATTVKTAVTTVKNTVVTTVQNVINTTPGKIVIKTTGKNVVPTTKKPALKSSAKKITTAAPTPVKGCNWGPLSVNGRIFYDNNTDGTWTPGVDTPVSNLRIYMGRKGSPVIRARAITGAQGMFRIGAPRLCRTGGFVISLDRTLANPIYTFWIPPNAVGQAVFNNVLWPIKVPKTAAKKTTSKKAGATTSKKLVAKETSQILPAGATSTLAQPKTTTKAPGATTSVKAIATTKKSAVLSSLTITAPNTIGATHQTSSRSHTGASTSRSASATKSQTVTSTTEATTSETETSTSFTETSTTFTQTTSTPIPVPNITYYQMGLSEKHSCRVFGSTSQVVKCFGNSDYGELGQESTDTLGDTAGEMASISAIYLGPGRTAKQVCAGYGHTCFLTDDNKVKCIGLNDNGQLGRDNTDSYGSSSGDMSALNPINLGTGRNATQISCGYYYSCAILDTGALKCWGVNDYGQLGLNSMVDKGATSGSMAGLAAVNLGAGRTCKQVAAGYYHTCAVLDTSALKCWGNADYGQLGYDSTTYRGDSGAAGHTMATLPTVNVGAGRKVQQVAVGTYHTVALLDDGSVKAWGYGSYGQLGRDDGNSIGGSSGDMASITPINFGGRNATQVCAGDAFTCAVMDDGTLRCWGSCSYGQCGRDNSDTIGDGTIPMANLTAIDFGGKLVKEVACGLYHVCVLLHDDSMRCFGSGSYGKLGYDNSNNVGDTPGSMAALGSVLFNDCADASCPTTTTTMSQTKTSSTSATPLMITTTLTYDAASPTQSITLPCANYDLNVELHGASGGQASGGNNVDTPPKGGFVSGTFSAQSPNQVIYFVIGAQGGTGTTTVGGTGGFPNGGAGSVYVSNGYGGGGGGGATQMFSAAGNQLLAVAGGAGGNGGFTGRDGGGGGGLVGGAGTVEDAGCLLVAGQGGTQAAGGKAGNLSTCANTGTFNPGIATFAPGNQGDNAGVGYGGVAVAGTVGGGGGGGYHGGGGGAFGGGGGGSSFYNSTLFDSVNNTQAGATYGNGRVVLTYYHPGAWVCPTKTSTSSLTRTMTATRTARTITTTFTYDGSTPTQSITLACANSNLTFELHGASGGQASGGNNAGTPPSGGLLSGVFTAQSANQVIYFVVGAQGGTGTSLVGGTGGFPNGGAGSGYVSNGFGGGGGGGATQMLAASGNQLLAVAAGAGGNGGFTGRNGGAGGGLVGADGTVEDGCMTVLGGKGGTQSAGGIAGNVSLCANTATFNPGIATPAASNEGDNTGVGKGGTAVAGTVGGGGGGGLHGGGGGAFGGGGGGSSFHNATAITGSVTNTQGGATYGDGRAVVIYFDPAGTVCP